MYDPTDPYGIKQLLAKQQQMSGINNNRHILHVHGEAGVDALQMLPDQELIVMDDTAPMIWVIKTDSAGYKGVKQAFDITPHVEQPAPDVHGMENRIAALEERLKGIESALNGSNPNYAAPGVVYAAAEHTAE